MIKIIDRLLNRQPTFSNPEEYWSYWKIEPLIHDLEKAVEISIEYTATCPQNYSLAEEFTNELSKELESIRQQDYPDLTDIWIWFAPAGAWNHFVTNDSSGIANQIFQNVEHWQQANGLPKL